MKRFLAMSVIGIFLLGSLSAGVIKKSKTSVKFKGFGKLITTTTNKIQGDFQREDSKKEFEGEGFMGKMMAKAFMQNGNSGQIVDLQNDKQYEINHSQKEYSVRPLEKIDWNMGQGKEAQGQDETVESRREKSNIRVIRQEFKVTKTGKEKNINGFDCQKYVVKGVTVWENTETGEQGTDSLSTIVWTTEAGRKIKNAQREEMEFQKKHLKKLGMEGVLGQEDILGTRWMGMFGSMNKGQGSHSDFSDSRFVKEMQKIKGYPVVINGKYFAIRPQKEKRKEREKNIDITDMQSVFGGLMGKAMKKGKKKKPAGREAAFSFRTEIMKIETGNVPASEFQPPQGYTKVEH